MTEEERKFSAKLQVFTVIAVVVLVIMIAIFLVITIKKRVLEEKLAKVYATEQALQSDIQDVRERIYAEISLEEYARQAGLLNPNENLYTPD